MAVRIRLARHGRRNRPFFWIVVANSRAPRDGKFIEKLGFYDPKPNPIRLHVDVDRALYWLGVGAQPTEAARALLRKAGVYHLQFLLRGVDKGVHTREEAYKRFFEWVAQKRQKINLTVTPDELQATPTREEVRANRESTPAAATAAATAPEQGASSTSEEEEEEATSSVSSSE